MVLSWRGTRAEGMLPVESHRSSHNMLLVASTVPWFSRRIQEFEKFANQILSHGLELDAYTWNSPTLCTTNAGNTSQSSCVRDSFFTSY
ncbi:hypothetical protein PR048_000196 [Dryococelus australis]|uniref:Uncharacterized protein n=1 Tax=Dryococelus australis TaxID=614101 RepID=A0ABQ9IDY3_9NEOP|nr:hypothetical protein PR048_000196 [Dryococelus australis]